MPQPSDAQWLRAEREAAKLTLPDLARAVGADPAFLMALEAGIETLSESLRFRVRTVCLARLEDLARAEENRSRVRTSKFPGLVAVLALVDPGTLTAAIAEAERRRQAGHDVGYEVVLGEWAARPR
jgi:transcriptional regulator with XRE-family HTH domain